MTPAPCKICHSADLTVYAHTATCRACGVLLYYPYLSTDELLRVNTPSADFYAAWYYRSAAFNHTNFMQMLRYAVTTEQPSDPLAVLDYGGGGGQFALTVTSHFPNVRVYLVDLIDDSCIPAWSPLNHRIHFGDFPADLTRFDLIFLNDVFEHVADPQGTLELLSDKLKPTGKIFIDTPRQFWLYPLTRALSRHIHTQLLRGTVSPAHLQIWSTRAFQHVVSACGLRVVKQTTWAEFTMPPAYYLDNMGIQSPVLRGLGIILYRTASLILRNKLICLLSK